MKYFILFCLCCTLVFCTQDTQEGKKTDDDADISALAKTYIEASKLKSDVQVAREEKARKALKKAHREQKEKRMEILRREKDIKLKQLMDKTSQMNKQDLLDRINSYDNEVMKVANKIAKKTAVQVPTVAGADVVVTLASLNRVVGSNEATIKITTNTGLTVDCPTLAAREIAVKASHRIVRSAENIALRNLMKEATLNPAASNKLIKMLFFKIYAHDAARAKQKAFARVEAMMKLPEGSLYKQYMQGVRKPSLKVAKNDEKTDKPVKIFEAKDTTSNMLNVENNNEDKYKDKNAQVLATYDIINNMDLTTEQEIPEALLNVLNKDLRNKAAKEEEEENESKLAKLKTYLFGKKSD